MNNFDTVREALELATPHYQADTARFAAALTALTAIEADHYSAADMADAQAKAFRAGVASVTVEQELVGWRYQHDETGRHMCHSNDGINTPEDFMKANPRWKLIGPMFAAPVAQQPQAEPQDVGQLEYRGNSVAYIHQKMTAYRSAIDAAWEAMRDAGHPPDGRTPLAQAITKALAAPQQAEAVPSDVMKIAEQAKTEARNWKRWCLDAEKDASRYRWLREQSWHGASLFVVQGGKDRLKLGTYCPSTENLDTVIDSAIAAQGAKT